MFAPFVGTGSVAKSYLLESKHGIVIGCEEDRHCMMVVIPSVFCLFAEKVLFLDSSIEKEPDVSATVEQYNSALKKSEAQKQNSVWKMQSG